MKNFNLFTFLLFIAFACSPVANPKVETNYKEGDVLEISRQVLQDKIKGGWAGQVIGCTYGGPTEFKYNGTIIGDETPIPWDEHQMLWWYENAPGLYDDVYMDLTFVDIFEKHGLEAPDSLHALAFANADYMLWHANQAARYNILNGIMPPASGHWKNNPHADDIDFQIEADFAGLMTPGMPASAVEICNKIGRIMNYGDGLYGGMYVAAMYSLAFVNDDINIVVEEALKVVPDGSEFHQLISDVIAWHKQYPNDWKQTWYECQKKWTYDKGCPDGVFRAFNIDAKINAAYIVIGLLYGEGDFGKTVDISTRCGYDSDCNPANAAGILGTLKGFNNIPDYWKQGLDKVEDLNFSYTSMSLNKVYEIGTAHAVEMIKRNGGSTEGENLKIKYQTPKSVPLEVAFEGIYPVERTERKGRGSKSLTEKNSYEYDINGCGFVITGSAQKSSGLPDMVLEADLYVNDQLVESVMMPTNYLTRKHDVAWKYDLPEGIHKLKLVGKNIPIGYQIQIRDVIVYSSVEPEKRVYF